MIRYKDFFLGTMSCAWAIEKNVAPQRHLDTSYVPRYHGPKSGKNHKRTILRRYGLTQVPPLYISNDTCIEFLLHYTIEIPNSQMML